MTASSCWLLRLLSSERSASGALDGHAQLLLARALGGYGARVMVRAGDGMAMRCDDGRDESLYRIGFRTESMDHKTSQRAAASERSAALERGAYGALDGHARLLLSARPECAMLV